MIELRVLTADDWGLWRELRLAALAEAPYAFGSRLSDWQGEGDREDRWRSRLDLPGSLNLVAVRDGHGLGMASGVPEGGGVVKVISMWVSPVARGLGVGDLLVQAVEDWARKGKATVLRLAVVPDNNKAVALYQRHGFRRTEIVGDLMPDGVRTEMVMAKPLTTEPAA
ncbi:MAG: GNAT family N-acetyltransferase [Nocardioidaceae bacterium]